jgi:kynurenine--oxoglutarate transaminase/cysteine-S-conjugate beta-lyase/glutamine--phenylpyruvate transaminase
MIKNIQGPANHQYSRNFGMLRLSETLAKHYTGSFNRQIDAASEVLVANGVVSALYNTITALVEPGDEVVFLEPFLRAMLLWSSTQVGRPLVFP